MRLERVDAKKSSNAESSVWIIRRQKIVPTVLVDAERWKPTPQIRANF